MNKKKITMMLPLTALIIVGAYTQENGMTDINGATKMVASYFDPGIKLIYVTGAVVGLIGGIKVYNKFGSDNPDTSKVAASWFGVCILLIVTATVLRPFFLQTVVQWEVSKGAGRTVESKGLKAQYLSLFAGGLPVVFFLVVVLYLCGIDQIVCLGLGLVGATLVVW